MNNPWLKLAMFSLASIVVVVVLLWGMDAFTGYNSINRTGYYNDSYQGYASFPIHQDLKSQQWGLQQRSMGNFQMQTPQGLSYNQVPQQGMTMPNNMMYQNRGYGQQGYPSVNMGAFQNQTGMGSMGMMHNMQDMQGMMGNMQGMNTMNNRGNMQGNSGSSQAGGTGMGMM